MVERSLGVREIPGSIPGSPKPVDPLFVSLVFSRQPSGHSTTAEAVESALRTIELTVKTMPVDLSQAHPRLGPALAWLHFRISTSAPDVWTRLYDRAEAVSKVQRLCRPLRAWHRRRMRRFAGETSRPGAIVCTQALACAAFALEKSEGRLDAPLVAVITDFMAHAYWISKEVDLYLAPTQDCFTDLVGRGVEPSRIRVTGIPIHPKFADPVSTSAARRELGLDPYRPTILLAGGSKGIGPLEPAASALLRGVPQIQLLVACGNNEGLRRRLMRRFAPARNPAARFHALAFTPYMNRCLAAADLFVGKPGGVSTAEAMAMGVPLMLLEPLPGAERRNADFLLRRGAAVESAGPSSLAEEVRGLLNLPQRLARLRGEAMILARPDSAAAAARSILSLAKVDALFRRASFFG